MSALATKSKGVSMGPAAPVGAAGSSSPSSAPKVGGRGGAREGAGRKASSDPAVAVNITLPSSVAEKLRQKAKSQGVTLSAFVRSVLDRNS